MSMNQTTMCYAIRSKPTVADTPVSPSGRLMSATGRPVPRPRDVRRPLPNVELARDTTVLLTLAGLCVALSRAQPYEKP
jgi:hypothetical protein